MTDATGLSGTFDFLLEFTPDPKGVASPTGVDTALQPEGPTFEEALRDQLGLKLESRKSVMDIITVDHIEHPSPN